MKWLIALNEIVSKIYVEATGGFAVYIIVCVFFVTSVGMHDLMMRLINLIKYITT